mgnify:CR=1 FL=1
MRLVVDIETNGFLDVLTTIHCISACDIDTGTYYNFRPDKIDHGIKLLSEADELIAHNGIKFDVPAIQKLYPSFTPKKLIDTLVCTRLIWADIKEYDADLIRKEILPRKLFGSHSLKAWGYRLKMMKGDYGEQDNAWDVFTEEMLEYCEQDVRVTVALWNKIVGQNYSQQALDLEHRVAEIMWQQERNGFVFNEDKADELFVELAAKRSDIQQSLWSLFTPWVTSLGVQTPKRSVNYRDALRADRVQDAPFTAIKIVEFNPGSREHIYHCLAKKYVWKPNQFTPSGSPKIDDEVLQRLPYPEAKTLAEYFMLQKRLGQLAEGAQGWLKNVKNGKLHGSVMTNGCVTGRASHTRPNIGQVPSTRAPYGKQCRELFTVPKGWKLMGADASGLELRCLGSYMSQWDGGAYIKELLEGDIHTTNQHAAGLPSRDASKRFIYAFNYGGGDALIGKLVGGGAKEGKAIKNRFLEKTPALKKLREAVTEAAGRGYLIGLDGRHVKIRAAFTGVNFLLQSAGAIICKQWLVEFTDEMKAQGYVEGWDADYCMCAWVHDEIQVACRADIAEKVGEIAVQTIRRVTEVLNFNCPLDGEYNIGDSWADTH